MRLTLVVSGLPALDAREDAAPAADPGVPALPLLSRLLSRSVAEGGAARAWYQRLAGELGGAALAGATPGAIAAAALALPAGTPAWLAQPVHLFAAIDHVRLPASGLLELDPADAVALCADFARAFGADALGLHVVGAGLVLTGLPPSAGPPDPAELAGSRLDARELDAPPALRRLAGEIELWLHDHPVNAARTRAARLPVNALWIWGGGTVAGDVRVTPAAMQVGGRHPVAAGLASIAGTALDDPRDLDTALASRGAPERVVELGAGALATIEHRWLEPAIAALSRGDLRAVRVMIGRHSLVLRRRDRLRLWRRTRPWWEHLRR